MSHMRTTIPGRVPSPERPHYSLSWRSGPAEAGFWLLRLTAAWHRIGPSPDTQMIMKHRQDQLNTKVARQERQLPTGPGKPLSDRSSPNAQLVLARGNITNTDELIIILGESDNEPAALVIRWPAAASVASRAAFPTTASKITAVVASAPYGWPAQGKAHVEVEESEPLVP
jgi:hypothetical protein